jgi:hypothetical protein
MRKSLLILAGLALALTATITTATPASADYPNPYASWACGGTRPTAQFNVAVHAHPEEYVGNPPSLLVTCEWRYPQISKGAVWAAYLLPDGTPFGPLNGYHYYDY